MTTILITGADGFIGRHVRKGLEGQARIATTRENSLGKRVDLLDATARKALIAAERPDVLVHLAWETTHGKFWHAPENTDWEEASVELFAEFYRNGGRRVVATGSCAEYDWTTNADRFSETDPLAPHTLYGTAKVQTARRLAELAETFGTEWAWGRIFFSFGAGEPSARLIPTMLDAVLRREPMGCGPASTKRDIWDVRCLGAALASLTRSDLTGTFNVASGTAVNFGELAGMIEGFAGKTGLINPDQRELGTGEPLSLVADATRLRNELGFRDPIDLEEGLRDYLETLRKTRS